MNAGKLDRRITFQSHIKTTDAYGEQVESWSDTLTVWAFVEQDFTNSTDEETQADKITAIGVTAFSIRYRSGITEQMRINFEGTIYNILAIAEIPRRVGIKIRAERKE